MRSFEEIWEEYGSEIRHLAGSYIVIALLVSFMVWQSDTKGSIMESLVVLAAIATAFVAIPAIMGTMVLISDILEELFRKED